MSAIIDQNEAPSHLFSIPELDPSEDLFVERLTRPWFRLGAWTIKSRRDKSGLEKVFLRKSFLLPCGGFTDLFDRLGPVGNVIGHMGEPGGSLRHENNQKVYRYRPFHEFEFGSRSLVAEPLVFVRFTTTGVQLVINPDLWLFLKLEETAPNSGIWWDPPRGIEAIRQHVIEQDNLQIVEIRTDYLCKYLQARQLSLIVGHYCRRCLYDTSRGTNGLFTEGEEALGSRDQGAKAIIRSWKPEHSVLREGPSLQREGHLWFQIAPPAIDLDDPWLEEPPFDPYTFTFPTRVGPVAPARWAHFRGSAGRKFDGETSDFSEPVCFRQEVLSKYEGASGFNVADDGSISCYADWALTRIWRLGNELLRAAIGDFAQSVPFVEWPHWKDYAVEPPSLETATALRQEQTIHDAVNSTVGALGALDIAFARFAMSLGVASPGQLWRVHSKA